MLNATVPYLPTQHFSCCPAGARHPRQPHAGLVGSQAACALLDVCRTGSSQLEGLFPSSSHHLGLPEAGDDPPSALHSSCSPERQPAQMLCV
jgi:hypothetical protein